MVFREMILTDRQNLSFWYYALKLNMEYITDGCPCYGVNCFLRFIGNRAVTHRHDAHDPRFMA